MSSGSKKVVVGYRYYMGVHLILGHTVDAVLEFMCGENTAWTGNVTDNSTIYVNAPMLFGGDQREGGVQGYVDIMFGADDQPVNSYLASVISGPMPAFIGLTSIVYRRFMWSSMNPYFKTPWWRIRRVLKGWSRPVWYPEKAAIGRDMNPIHIVYQAYTDLEWGMGYSPSDMNEANWRAAADTIYNEGFGLSLGWVEQSSIEDFTNLILEHIDARTRVGLKSGQWEITLLRDNYTLSALPELNPSNCILNEFQRSAWGDTANEITVVYKDRYEVEQPVTVQDLANIEIQGAPINATKQYHGIREPSLAERVAIRELMKVSTPLAKVQITANRIAWDWDVTDVFRLNWPREGINGVAFRILTINKGELAQGRITIQAIEDIFGLPASSYVDKQESGWVDPITVPAPVVAGRAMEAPYYDVVKYLTTADIAYLIPDYAFGEFFAVRPSSDAFNFDLWSSASSGGVYVDTGDGDFCASGVLPTNIPIGSTAVTVVLNAARDLELVEIGSYCYIDNEAFGVTLVNILTGSVTLTRAALDTVPAPHAEGARVYFAESGMGVDPTTRSSGETTYYKPLPRTGKGTLPVASALPVGVSFVSRATRPFPPGNWRINNAYFPTTIYGSLTSQWAHRDRLQQTVSITLFTAGNIGPEAGTTYTVRVFNGTTQLRAYTGIATTSWSYPVADESTDGYLQTIRVTVESVRGTYASWQRHDITLDRHGLGFHLGEELGGVAS